MEKYKYKSYLFTLDYGRRMTEKKFIFDVLNRYEPSKLVGTGLWVNNNPYHFEFYFYLNFYGDTQEFEEWLNINYKEKERMFNFFMGDIISSMGNRSFTGMSGVEADFLLDLFFIEGGNFLFSEERKYNQIMKGGLSDKPTIFLSHSSRDNKLVDNIYNRIINLGLDVWYDKFEINENDDFVQKINEGLDKSHLGILFISNNFLSSTSGWTHAEMNYFIQKRISSGISNLICVNIDVPRGKMPSLLQEYRFIEYTDKGMQELLSILKRKVFIKYV